MSVENIAWAWNIGNLKPVEKLVLIYLADGVWGRSQFTLNQYRISQFSGLTEEEIAAVISSLCEHGLLRRCGPEFQLEVPCVEESTSLPRLPLSNAGYVYFLHAPELHRIKIGTSRTPLARVPGLAKQSPVQCVLLKMVLGGKKLEAQLHEKFAAERCVGEWFAASNKLLTYIESLHGINLAA